MYSYLNASELSELDGGESVLVRRAAEDVRQLSQALLLTRIEEQGRAVLGDPHHPDVSYGLWRALDNSPRLSEEDAEELRRLSEVADGWWLITDAGRPQFLSLTDWRQHFLEYGGG